MQYRFDLHSEVLRFAGHTIGPLFLHCRWIAKQPTALTRWLLHRRREAEPLPFYFHSPIMCIVVCFREHAPVAILAADSKRYFWAAWTVMKDCRSHFAWHCVYSLKRARSVGLTGVRSTTGPRGSGPATVGSAVLVRCGGYE